MQYQKKIKDKIVQIFLLLFFTYFISSINAPIFNPITSPSFKFSNIFEFINIIRSISPLITFIFLMFFIIFKFYQKNIYINKFYYLILVYLLIQIPFLYLIPIEDVMPGIYNNNFQDIYWIISGICAVFFFIIFENLNNKIGRNCMYIFGFVIFCVTFFFMARILKLFYYESIIDTFKFIPYYYGNVESDPNQKLLATSVPRTSGLSRNITIFFLIGLIIYLYQEGKKFIIKFNYKKININLSLKKSYLFFVLIILLFFIMNFQSRSTYLFLVTCFIIILFNYDNLSFFKKLISLTLIVVIATFIHKSEPKLRYKITVYTKALDFKKYQVFIAKKNELEKVRLEKIKIEDEDIKNKKAQIKIFEESIKNNEISEVNLEKTLKKIKDIEDLIIAADKEVIKLDVIATKKTTELELKLNKRRMDILKEYLYNAEQGSYINKNRIMGDYGLSAVTVNSILQEFTSYEFIFEKPTIKEPVKVVTRKGEKIEPKIVPKIEPAPKIEIAGQQVRVISSPRKINLHDSGRFYLWGQALKLIKANKYLYGYGPQADRKYIGENVSNTYLYIFLTSGIIGIICLLGIMIFQTYILFYSVFIFKIFKNKFNIIEKISIFLLLFIYSRTIFENTFAIFSIDMLVFLFANFFINTYYQRNKNLIKYN